MKVVNRFLGDCLVLESTVHADRRGSLTESFNQLEFDRLTGTTYKFVQENYTTSYKGVLRGFHYQIEQPQGKLIRVVRGEILEACVDLRKSSLHFGKSHSMLLSEKDNFCIWIPPGFAHAFSVNSLVCNMIYKLTDYFSPASELCIRWDDPDIGVDWKLEDVPILSAKDQNGAAFRAAQVYD